MNKETAIRNKDLSSNADTPENERQLFGLKIQEIFQHNSSNPSVKAWIEFIETVLSKYGFGRSFVL